MTTLGVANTTMKIYNVNSMIKLSDLRENYRVPHACRTRLGQAVRQAVRQAVVILVSAPLAENGYSTIILLFEGRYYYE